MSAKRPNKQEMATALDRLKEASDRSLAASSVYASACDANWAAPSHVTLTAKERAYSAMMTAQSEWDQARRTVCEKRGLL